MKPLFAVLAALIATPVSAQNFRIAVEMKLEKVEHSIVFVVADRGSAMVSCSPQAANSDQVRLSCSFDCYEFTGGPDPTASIKLNHKKTFVAVNGRKQASVRQAGSADCVAASEPKPSRQGYVECSFFVNTQGHLDSLSLKTTVVIERGLRYALAIGSERRIELAAEAVP
jgi:hypothetical protein